ncbi:MAG: PAS domain-containing protein [Acidobacteria bacterium]|nr:PAS domain-containing protein [Acidobacteriota bacterium]
MKPNCPPKSPSSKKSPALAVPVSTPASRSTNQPAPVAKDVFPVVGIGASAGGLEAFTQLLSTLPPDTGMAFVLVQHLSPHHKSELVNLLSKTTAMPVREVEQELPIQPNHVYVIPPNASLTISDGKLVITERLPEQGISLPINTFFESLAHEYKELAIGIILSGNASDGVVGLKNIKSEGGVTFVQTEGSAKFPSMPRNAILSGHADFILPPDQIAAGLARLSQHTFTHIHSFQESGDILDNKKSELDKLFGMIRAATGVDFRHYKSNTIQRRITRRMKVCQIDTFSAYVTFLRKNQAELDLLFQDLLIPVTQFFRDPESFTALQRLVFARLTNLPPSDLPLRIWVPGCSTGEEAYSIAMVVLETLSDTASSRQTRIFATDVNLAMVERGRLGIYPREIEANVSPERLSRFFVPTENGYQISKTIRNMCIFAHQNVISDPPFSKVDLISCRNVFIYFDSPLQRQVLHTFHYALKPNGFLLLGNTETIGVCADLFLLVDKKGNLYQKKSNALVSPVHFKMSELPIIPGTGKQPMSSSPTIFDPEILKEADRLVLARYAPPGVVVNAQLNIVQFRGSTGLYLDPTPGVASLNLMKMAQPGLLPHLSQAISEADRKKAPVRWEGATLELKNGFQGITVVVIPLLMAELPEPHFLVLFEPEPTGLRKPDETKFLPEVSETPPPEWELERTSLRQELVVFKEYLQSVIEKQVATNEELQSANEEALSSNEELQSLNEELETAKEELQSTNEELITVNDELQNRNQELAQLNNDLSNLLDSVEMGFVVLDRELRIKRFTPMAGKILNLIPTDLGRPFSHINPNLHLPDLPSIFDEVVNQFRSKELELQDQTGRWYSLRFKPYKTLDYKIDGMVIALVEIDLLKRSVEAAEFARELSDAILETIQVPMVVLNKTLRIVQINEAFRQRFGVQSGVIVNQPFFELGTLPSKSLPLRTLLEDMLFQNQLFQRVVIELESDTMGRTPTIINVRRIEGHRDPAPLLLLAFELPVP